MNAKEAKEYSDSFKDITKKEERRFAVSIVKAEIKSACEINNYEIGMYERESWTVKRHIDYIVTYFEELGYYAEKDAYAFNEYNPVMLYISWD